MGKFASSQASRQGGGLFGGILGGGGASGGIGSSNILKNAVPSGGLMQQIEGLDILHNVGIVKYPQDIINAFINGDYSGGLVDSLTLGQVKIGDQDKQKTGYNNLFWPS